MHTLKSRSHQRSWRFRRLPARRCCATPPSLIGAATTATNTAGTVFSFTWSNVAAGSYSITAQATDNLNASTTSTAQTVTVIAPNQSPAITLNSPGASFTAPAAISLSASANDPDGTVQSVAFYSGANLIGNAVLASGTNQSGTWTFNWSNVAAGNYNVTALATDNAGTAVQSNTVQITVNAPVAGAAPGLYFIEVDHLNTPRRIANQAQQAVWKMENTEAFGDSIPNENPSNLGTFEFNQRFPGQYADKETGLSYNYFRDYNSALGRYVQSDPIGLEGGINTYGYVFANPLRFSDPFGLDVLVCFYGNAAGGAGHVGFGSPGGAGTSGFYPGKGESAFGGKGAVLPDRQSADRFDSCKVVPADDKQDKCMEKCKLDRSTNPGTYHLTKRNCTMYTRDCLAQCGLPTGSGSGPAPERFFHGLPGSYSSR